MIVEKAIRCPSEYAVKSSVFFDGTIPDNRWKEMVQGGHLLFLRGAATVLGRQLRPTEEEFDRGVEKWLREVQRMIELGEPSLDVSWMVQYLRSKSKGLHALLVSSESVDAITNAYGAERWKLAEEIARRAAPQASQDWVEDLTRRFEFPQLSDVL